MSLCTWLSDDASNKPKESSGESNCNSAMNAELNDCTGSTDDSIGGSEIEDESNVRVGSSGEPNNSTASNTALIGATE